MRRGIIYVSAVDLMDRGELVRRLFQHFELNVLEKQPDLFGEGEWFLCASPAFEDSDDTPRYSYTLEPELTLKKEEEE